MKRIFGCKERFAIEYETASCDECYFEMWVDNKPLCRFTRRDVFQRYHWNLNAIVVWFEENMDYILAEEAFPLPVQANSSVEFYNKCIEFDSDDENIFDNWFDTLQNWCFHHSWFINRDGSFLPDVYFRSVGEKIEINWDSTSIYYDVSFQFPNGIYYADKESFSYIVKAFVNSYREYIMGDNYEL